MDGISIGALKALVSSDQKEKDKPKGLLAGKNLDPAMLKEMGIEVFKE